MDKESVRRLATELFIKHGLLNWNKPDTVWNFQFDRAMCRAGLCSYSHRTITISEHYIALNSEQDIRDTILHEIAHALAPHNAHHGPMWKLIAASIGARPERCTAQHVITPTGKYSGKCDCRTHYMHRRPKLGRTYRCTVCRSKVNWEL